jgi:hypothetical protein
MQDDVRHASDVVRSIPFLTTKEDFCEPGDERKGLSLLVCSPSPSSHMAKKEEAKKEIAAIVRHSNRL